MSAAIESDLSAKEKGMTKDEITKMLQQNEENLTIMQKNDHRQHFQENASTITKNIILTN